MPLFVVATPLGNLEDITRRAERVLREVDEIIAEDTRHSRRLLDALHIRANLTAYHDHSGPQVVARLVEALVAGRSMALITDAGTPCISDPGYGLVRAAQDAGVTVVPIPGPSAVVAFLSAAGLPTDQFTFVGFAPRKEQERLDAVRGWLAEARTTVAYETPQRCVELLEVIARLDPAREIAVGRELTKLHEEIQRGPAAAIAASYGQRETVRGELVVAISPRPPQAAGDAEVDAWVAALAPLDVRPRELARAMAAQLGVRADDLYDRILRARPKG